MWSADKWEQYRLIDSADGEKLEYWGDYLLRRPDPQAVWSLKSDKKLWNKADAWYHRSKSGGGKWEYLNKKLPERWTVNWDWFSELIKKADRPIRVLNLFAYTGGATVAALEAGAEVVHVDASKGMVTWAKENVVSSGLGERPVRYIVDDVVKFVLIRQRYLIRE